MTSSALVRARWFERGWERAIDLRAKDWDNLPERLRTKITNRWSLAAANEIVASGENIPMKTITLGELLTDEQKALLGIVNGPVWHDGCNHQLSSHVASFQILVRGPALKSYDLYVFDQHKQQSVCIRYGDEPGEYISPGSITSFIQSACLHRVQSPEYWAAFQILKELGSLKWQPNVPVPERG